MTDFFLAASALVFGREGPYSDDPQDSGGSTKWGVARAEHPEITDAEWDVWTKDDSLRVFRTYWDGDRCGEMPWPWALGVYDCGINEGEKIGAELAQQTLGLKVDGSIGPVTLAAMQTASAELFDNFMAERAERYATRSTAGRFERGWFRRLFIIHRAALGEPPA